MSQKKLLIVTAMVFSLLMTAGCNEKGDAPFMGPGTNQPNNNEPIDPALPKEKETDS